MKKLLLSLAIVLSSSAFAADDSVYAWGPWAEGIKPAAGPVYVAPAPVSEPQVDVRESMALLREFNERESVFNEIHYTVAPPAVPGMTQVSGTVVTCTPSCGGSTGMNTGTQF